MAEQFGTDLNGVDGHGTPSATPMTVTLGEAAERLGISMNDIRKRIRKGQLQSRQVSTAEGIAMGVELSEDRRPASEPMPPQSRKEPVAAAATVKSPPPFLVNDHEPSGPADLGEPNGNGHHGPPPNGRFHNPPMEPSESRPDIFAVVGQLGERMSDETADMQPLDIGISMAPEAHRANGRSHNGFATASRRRKFGRGVPMQDLVAALRDQINAQAEELEARRREVQELHMLLKQLHAGAFPPVAITKGSFIQRLLRPR